MLTKAGAKLVDFGLAKNAAPAIQAASASMLPTTPPSLTSPGTILGTFQYMAPEQIEGLEADARTDIFAFGALLFEMLTGRPAFEGKTRASLLGAILKDTPPPVSSVRTAVPAALDRIVSTCLEKDPDNRYQSARDLLRDLKWAASAGAGSVAEPRTAPPLTSEPARVARRFRCRPRSDGSRDRRPQSRKRRRAQRRPGAVHDHAAGTMRLLAVRPREGLERRPNSQYPETAETSSLSPVPSNRTGSGCDHSTFRSPRQLPARTARRSRSGRLMADSSHFLRTAN